MKRQTAVVAVVVNIAPAARVYVQEKRVSKVPEIGGGMTALSAQVSAKTKISSAPRVYGWRRCGVRGACRGGGGSGGRTEGERAGVTNTEDKEDAQELQQCHLVLANAHPAEHGEEDRHDDLKET
eukprot:scaffold7257_cov65-Phaeocystis_antarctica.AAC.6